MSGYERERLLWRAALTIERRFRQLESMALREGYSDGEIDYLTALWVLSLRRESRRRYAYLQARLLARGVDHRRYMALLTAHAARRPHPREREREERSRVREQLRRRRGTA